MMDPTGYRTNGIHIAETQYGYNWVTQNAAQGSVIVTSAPLGVQPRGTATIQIQATGPFGAPITSANLIVYNRNLTPLAGGYYRSYSMTQTNTPGIFTITLNTAATENGVNVFPDSSTLDISVQDSQGYMGYGSVLLQLAP